MHLNNVVAFPLLSLAAAQYGSAPAASSNYAPIVNSAASIYTSISSVVGAYTRTATGTGIATGTATGTATTSSSQGVVSATVAAGATLKVAVGQNGLAYTPNVVSAAPGAKIEYHYFPKNHSVVQSSFDKPCQPLAGGNGVNSGFVPVPQGESPQVFTVTVNDTNPVWIYCAQTNGNHCQAGMSMVINQPAPPSPNSLQAYQAAAKGSGTSGSLPKVQGGVFSNSTGPIGANPPPGPGYPGAPPTPYPGAPGTTRPPVVGTPTTTPRPGTPTGAPARYTGAANKEGVAGGVVLGGAVMVAGLLL